MKQHNCPNCVYSTVDKRYLRNHIKNVHEEPKTIDANVETANHFCSQCDYKTYSERGLKHHIGLAHRKECEFKCTKCEYSSNLAHTLELHIKTKRTAQCTLVLLL